MERHAAPAVLVVATVELSGPVVAALVGPEPVQTLVVVPATRQSRLQWLANEEDRARDVARAASERIATELPGAAEAQVGDPDPLRAIEDALETFPADEILVVTRPEDEAGWLEQRAGDRDLSDVRGIPVRRVLLHADGSREER